MQNTNCDYLLGVLVPWWFDFSFLALLCASVSLWCTFVSNGPQAMQEGAADAVRREGDFVVEAGGAEQGADPVAKLAALRGVQGGEPRLVELDDHAPGAHAAAHGLRSQRFADQLLGPMHQRQHVRIDRDAGFDAARQAGRSGQL